MEFQKGTSTIFDDYNEHIFTVPGINISGDIVIEISNIYKPIIIDDISWTGYTLEADFSADATTVCQGTQQYHLQILVLPQCGQSNFLELGFWRMAQHLQHKIQRILIPQLELMHVSSNCNW